MSTPSLGTPKLPVILVCVPVYRFVEPEPFMQFLVLSHEAGMAEARKEYVVRWMVPKPKMQIQNTRNTACRVLRSAPGITHVAFIDDDMLAEPKDLFRQLLASDKDIVSPLFFRSEPPYDPLVFRSTPDGMLPMEDYPQNCLFRADAVGTGVMLIKRKVIDTMPDPWFYYPEGSNMSMDLQFCRNAAAAGFEVWCDSSLVVKQMGTAAPIGVEHFRAYRQISPNRPRS